MLTGTPNSALIYDLIFALAHFTSWSFLIWYGYKHKYDKIEWLLIIITGYIIFTIGTHLALLDIKSWQSFFINNIFPHNQGKSLISGLILAVPAMLLVSKLLRFQYSIFEPFSFSIPMSIAIQRFGCTYVGCCYGVTSDLPWSISYHFGHPLHYKLWLKGLLSGEITNPVYLHPVQIYESALCLTAIIILYYCYQKKYFQNRLIYFSLLLYCFIRFTLEFVRSPQAHLFEMNNYYGLNPIQWVLMISIISLIFYLAIVNKKLIKSIKNNENRTNNNFYITAWLLIVVSFVITFQKKFTPPELLLLSVLIIPLTTIITSRLLQILKFSKYRIAIISISVISVFLMGQKSTFTSNDSTRSKYHEISIGAIAGNNTKISYTTGCDGSTTNQYEFDDRYKLAGIGYKYVSPNSNGNKLTTGLNLSYGELISRIDNVGSYSTFRTIQDTEYIINVSPHIKFDFKRIGLGIGANVGNLPLYRYREDYGNSTVTNTKSIYFLPKFHFRWGTYSKVWGEFNYGFNSIGLTPSNEFELFLGIKSTSTDNSFRIGTSAHHILVLQPTFTIKQSLDIQPYLGIGGALTDDLFSGAEFKNRMGHVGGLNINYRIYPKK